MNYPPTPEAERCRIKGPFGENYGAFIVKIGAFRLNCIVACAMGWDHVSVSLGNRCPTWAEMDYVKRLFWPDHEVVMQLHVQGESKINFHPYCLHLWRPQTAEEHALYNRAMRQSGENPPEEWYAAPTPGPIPLPPIDCV